jgi:hypothetical protein
MANDNNSGKTYDRAVREAEWKGTVTALIENLRGDFRRFEDKIDEQYDKLNEKLVCL